jgi:uncharacterized protein YebE (UPF0316 family)
VDWNVAGICLLIVIARIADVSLGTMRTICVVQGRRRLAPVLGFFEVLIWVFGVSQVVTNLSHPACAVSYALGFALGNYIGLTIERRLAMGEQVVRVFSHQGAHLAGQLRRDGFRVTEIDGRGRDGPIHLLFIHAPRKQVNQLANRVLQLDPACFYVIDDVRLGSNVAYRQSQSLAA